jgi:hypothetical protein
MAQGNEPHVANVQLGHWHCAIRSGLRGTHGFEPRMMISS